MELWTLYDADRNPLPGTHERGKPIPAGARHLVVEIWSFDKNGRLLLTLRHPDKHFGSTWECTGGSALAGESSLTAMRRELAEETGLDASATVPTLLTTLTTHNTIYDIYAVTLDFTLSNVTLQEGETVDKRLIDPHDLLTLPNLCPPIAERLKTSYPYLQRYASGAERRDMYTLDGQLLGYNRLRPLSNADEPQHPWEMSLSAITFLQRSDGKLLLTQRAAHKAAPLQWGNTGGGADTGETPLQALLRETREEIGLTLSPDEPQFLEKFVLGDAHDRWCLYVYLTKKDLDIEDLTLQESEVVDAKYVSPDELWDHPLVAGMLRRSAGLCAALGASR